MVIFILTLNLYAIFTQHSRGLKVASSCSAYSEISHGVDFPYKASTSDLMYDRQRPHLYCGG
jgi:hypothetical protein